MPPRLARGTQANRLLRVMALSAEPWNESWNDSGERRVQSAHCEHCCGAVRAGRAPGAAGRAYGKEKVYGSIP
jgi:hypothetical protein